MHLFYLITNCFRPEDYCKAICAEPGKTRWTRERHLVPFVSLDLCAVSVIDLCLYKGGTNEQRIHFCFLFFYFSFVRAHCLFYHSILRLPAIGVCICKGEHVC